MDLPKLLANFPQRLYAAGLTAVLLLLSACASASPTATAVTTAASTQPTASPTAPPAIATMTALPEILPTPTAIPAEITAETASVPDAPTAPATAVPTLSPTESINGIPVADIVILPPETAAHVREIFARGQELGRNPHAFSKLGDSAVLVSSYLTRFDEPKLYNLGEWAFLQPTIDHYAGSFQRYGVATRVGLSSWGVMDPAWADKEYCQPNEIMLACELRLYNPSVVLMRLGTNDVNAETFEKNMRDILDYCLEQGVIPILATKADRAEGENNLNNEVIVQLAAEYQVPLWDFDAVAGTLPEHGLEEDNLHLTANLKNDYTDPETWTYGYPVSDLTALLMLDAVQAALAETQP